MSKLWNVSLGAAAGIVFLALMAALPSTATAGQDPAANEASRTELQRVEPQMVCMVNDQAMGKLQIAVEVDHKTYYGCCEMCKQRLAQDEAVRRAVDPVTGEVVDKATAVIAARSDGSVLYFSSEETLRRYAGDPVE
jgi:YHS domain-containing protein